MTRDDIIRMAREAQMPYYYRTGEVTNLEQLERFAALVRADEREACIEIVAMHGGSVEIEAAIRARGQE